jgi:DNA polymerase/3'-5' exonuclease PolX
MKKNKFPYEQALRIAEATLEQLRPHCIRAEIAGSIRRKKAEVGDIEIVIIPKPFELGLFESGIASVVNKWEKVRGELPCKYTQRILPEGIALDLFFAEESNWGNIFAIRTGSADYSHKVLATQWVKCGFKSIDGHLWREDEQYSLCEEEDLFQLIGIPYVAPEYRNI